MDLTIDKVSDVLHAMRAELNQRRDNEIMMASEVLGQYVHHNDKQAYKDIDRQVNRLAKAWDKMITKLEKWTEDAEKIEASCENFYGD